MKSPRTGIKAQAHSHTSSATPRPESTRDVLDVLANSIAKTAERETKPEPYSMFERSRLNPAEKS